MGKGGILFGWFEAAISANVNFVDAGLIRIHLICFIGVDFASLCPASVAAMIQISYVTIDEIIYWLLSTGRTVLLVIYPFSILTMDV